LNVETEIVPPGTDEDGDGDIRSGRLSVGWLAVDDAAHDAAVQLFGDAAADPERFADALLRAALALASLVGPDHSWAVQHRLAAYDGTAPRPGDGQS